MRARALLLGEEVTTSPPCSRRFTESAFEWKRQTGDQRLALFSLCCNQMFSQDSTLVGGDFPMVEQRCQPPSKSPVHPQHCRQTVDRRRRKSQTPTTPILANTQRRSKGTLTIPLRRRSASMASTWLAS
jgi:hypothetical protein